MSCIEKIYSVSALVGDGKCNANCAFCAGKPLRRSHVDQVQYERCLESAIKLSARYGGWSLSLTSGGEPTCEPAAVTKALEVYSKCSRDGAYFPTVVLFTNGILLADPVFCKAYLPVWKRLGLTSIAVSIHGTGEEEQANAYGLKEYPKLDTIFNNIREHGLAPRCTLLLRRGGIDSAESYKIAVDWLISLGVDNITSWTVGEQEGKRNKFTPSRLSMLGIRYWLWRNTMLCHGHAWGGGVYDYNGNILRLTSYVTKHNPRKNFVRQLVVFTDNTVDYSWIRKGARCLK